MNAKVLAVWTEGDVTKIAVRVAEDNPNVGKPYEDKEGVQPATLDHEYITSVPTAQLQGKSPKVKRDTFAAAVREVRERRVAREVRDNRQPSNLFTDDTLVL